MARQIKYFSGTGGTLVVPSSISFSSTSDYPGYIYASTTYSTNSIVLLNSSSQYVYSTDGGISWINSGYGSGISASTVIKLVNTGNAIVAANVGQPAGGVYSYIGNTFSASGSGSNQITNTFPQYYWHISDFAVGQNVILFSVSYDAYYAQYQPNVFYLPVASLGTAANVYSCNIAEPWSCIAHNGASTFVMLRGYSNQLGFGAANTNAVYSTSGGTSWTSMTVPTGNYTRVEYANGYFLAMGQGNVIRSVSGTSWTQVNSGGVQSTFPWRRLHYTNGLWIAIASNGSMTYSGDDGVTWATATIPQPNYSTSYISPSNGKLILPSNSGNTTYISNTAAVGFSTYTVPANRNAKITFNNLSGSAKLEGLYSIPANSTRDWYLGANKSLLLDSNNTTYSFIAIEEY